MTRLVVRSRVDADGVLRVTVPVGAADADREVQVTIESVATPAASHASYVAWLESIAGQWQGDFERLPQGDFEPRDEL
ncbi:MAG TPA: hypothetical protein VM165_07270 [Planctomycetaceae bacterium]|nr:hypothetical protein [Planctomycetaceae bacterium]